MICSICLPKSCRRWHLLRSWLSGHLGDPLRTTLNITKQFEVWQEKKCKRYENFIAMKNMKGKSLWQRRMKN